MSTHTFKKGRRHKLRHGSEEKRKEAERRQKQRIEAGKKRREGGDV